MHTLRQQLNWGHLALLVSLPIFLALINPNWIFNAGIADDYIYLGYQMALPKYIGHYPTTETYFVERLSVILPAYPIRQLLPPLWANFVVHLGMYYTGIFALYATLNRLFGARTALLTATLMGQFALFMRAVGWDYVDGYALVYLTLCLFFLTYAITTSNLSRACWYWMGAGASFMAMLTAQIFNLFYLPALIAYVWLLGWGVSSAGADTRSIAMGWLRCADHVRSARRYLLDADGRMAFIYQYPPCFANGCDRMAGFNQQLFRTH